MGSHSSNRSELGSQPTSGLALRDLYQTFFRLDVEWRAPRWDELTVEEKIKRLAKANGVDGNLARNIAWAESRFKCDARNRRSSAGGVYQFIDATWLNTQKRLGKPLTLDTKYDCDENIEAGIYLISQGELHHWNASKTKWQTW